MKKLLFVLMTGLFLVALVIGCGQKEEPQVQTEDTTEMMDEAADTTQGMMEEAGETADSLMEEGTDAAKEVIDEATGH